MTLNEYQAKAMATCMSSCDNIAYMLTGLNAEVGEINGKIAKAIRKEQIDIIRNNLAQELARIMAEIADYLRDFHYEKVFELNDRQRLGAKIMALRNERGYSIRTLAELCDVNKATIVNIEQGRFSPRFDIVERIVKELGGTIEIK